MHQRKLVFYFKTIDYSCATPCVTYLLLKETFDCEFPIKKTECASKFEGRVILLIFCTALADYSRSKIMFCISLKIIAFIYTKAFNIIYSINYILKD